MKSYEKVIDINVKEGKKEMSLDGIHFNRMQAQWFIRFYSQIFFKQQVQ